MARLPKGMVTFLAAVISAPTVGRRAGLLRKAVAAQGGVLFQDDGTTLYAVFSTVLPALQAALQTQRHSLAGARGSEQQAGVLLALHTGRAQEHAGIYFGPTLNRATSIALAAHPGQILLSASTHAVLEEQTPADVQLHNLGEYRLKDLFRTAQLYQVLAPELPAEFPPLNTLDVRPHNLPIQSSPLIGREQEVATACDLLRDANSRLVTLLGSSGTGKTRLALQVAVEVIDSFAAGVYFVALAPISDPDLLISSIAQVVGVKEQPGEPLLTTLATVLHSSQMLLVLDNFEQLLVAAPALSQLLEATRAVKLLVTSQVALDLAQEQVFAVPPLSMPAAAGPISVGALSQIPAVALFVERAREVHPTFTLTATMAPALIELCTRLEGLPLAIELVAAQSKRYFPSDMLIMLQNRLSVARAIRRGNTREDTLRPVLDWICELLGSGVAGLFARLGVFSGGCTSESAQAICNPTNDLALEVDQALNLLLDNHLLLREELKQGHIRYTMLDAIHDYTRQRLTKRREAARLQSAHASYYTTLAETAEPLLKSAEQEHWLARLEDEHHNLRAALTWALAQNPELAVRLSGSISRFWFVHGHYTEGRRWLQAALAQGQAASPVARARALHGLGLLAYAQGEYDVAIPAYETALTLRRELGDTVGVIATMNNLGIIAKLRGEYAEAMAYFEACLPLSQELGDQWSVANAFNNLGDLTFDQADFARAETYFQASVVLREQLGDTWGLSIALNNLALVAYHQGDYDRASEVLLQGFIHAQDIDDERVQSDILEAQAQVHLAQGDLVAARKELATSTRIRLKQGQKGALVASLETFAALRIAEGEPAATPRLLGLAAALRDTLGLPAPLLQQRYVEVTTARALAQISQTDFAAAWQRGSTSSLEELLDDLLTPVPTLAS